MTEISLQSGCDYNYEQAMKEYRAHVNELTQLREKFYRENPDGPPNMFLNVVAPPQRISLTLLRNTDD